MNDWRVEINKVRNQGLKLIKGKGKETDKNKAE